MPPQSEGDETKGIRRRDLLQGVAILGLGGAIGSAHLGRAPSAYAEDLPVTIGPDETIDPGDIPDEFPNLIQSPQIFFTDLEIS